MKHREITQKIIHAFYQVYNKLGYGFLEKVYEKALMIELQKMRLHCQRQHPIEVYYENQIVGKYYADIIVNDLIIIELKASNGLTVENQAQLVNYLKATNIEIGLLLNFGPKAEFKRKIFENK